MIKKSSYTVMEVAVKIEMQLYPTRCVLAGTKGVPIIQKYLEKGHTQMECDSAHTAIERRKKHCDLHSPAQYVQGN